MGLRKRKKDGKERDEARAKKDTVSEDEDSGVKGCIAHPIGARGNR